MNLQELGTFDIEFEEEMNSDGERTGKRLLNVHCILNNRKNINDKVVKVSTSHVYQWLLKKEYNVEQCLKTDSARNISNSYGAHPRTAHWIFKVKSDQKPKRRTTRATKVQKTEEVKNAESK